jgi:hypothetical protein
MDAPFYIRPTPMEYELDGEWETNSWICSALLQHENKFVAYINTKALAFVSPEYLVTNPMRIYRFLGMDKAQILAAAKLGCVIFRNLSDQRMSEMDKEGHEEWGI